MAATDDSVRTSRHGSLESAHQHVVGFTCGNCAATTAIDSTTYEDILANGCPVCDATADASAFSRRKTV